MNDANALSSAGEDLFQTRFSFMLRLLLNPSGWHDFTLYLYAGEPDVGMVERIRSQIPDNAVLFYLYAAAGDGEKGLYDRIPPATLTLFSSLDDVDTARERIALVLSCLKLKTVQYASSGIDELAKAKLHALKEAAETTLKRLYHQRASRLVKLRGALHGVPLMLSGKSARMTPVGTPVPAVVCGAGPSISADLGTLKSLGSNVVVIAAGRMINILLESGIAPDFTVLVDSESDECWLRVQQPNSTLVAIANASHLIASQFERIIWGKADSAHFNQFADQLGIQLEDFAISGTASVTAIDFAVKSGFKPIALLGHDLCLDEGGHAHVEDYVDEFYDQSDTLETSGVGGTPVQTTPEFESLRQSIEKRVRQSRDAEGVEIYNCSPSGADIKGTSPMSFSDFARRFARRKPDRSFDQIAMDEERCWSGIAKCAELLREHQKSTQRLVDKLQVVSRHDDPALDAPRKMERTLANHPLLSGIVTALEEQCDELMFESARFRPRRKFKDRDLITDEQRRRRMILDLSLDLENDFRRLLASRNGGIGVEGEDILRFKGFRRYALNVIRKENPEFADHLASAISSSSDTFMIHYNWINPPHVRIRRDDGELIPLVPPFLGMNQVIANETRAFLDNLAFDPKKHGLVIVAPVNWLHVIEVVKRHPDASLLIVEPWPELLSRLIDSSMFTHFLPESTLVVGVDRSLDWRNACQRRLDKWRKDGLVPSLFVNPRARILPEVDRLEKLFTRLVRG